MNQATDTWYILADGTRGDPSDVSSGEDGVLRHKNGVAVKLRENGVPHTSGVGVPAAAELKADDDKSKPKGKNRELKADDDKSAEYKTR